MHGAASMLIVLTEQHHIPRSTILLISLYAIRLLDLILIVLICAYSYVLLCDSYFIIPILMCNKYTFCGVKTTIWCE
jgi:hypothetical protein